MHPPDRSLMRWWPHALATVLVVLVVSYVGYWYFLTSQLRDGWATLRTEQGRNLVQLDAKSVAAVGFPTRIALDVNTPILRKGGTPTYLYRADGLTVALNPFAPTQASLTTTGGAQHLTFRDDQAGTALDLSSGRVAGNLVLTDLGGALDHARVAADDVSGTLDLTPGKPGDAFAARAVEITVHPGAFARDGEPQQDAAIVVTGRDVTLPERISDILGNAIAYTTLDAQLTGGKGGPFRLDALAREGPRALRAFFEGDGRLDVTNFALQWGALDLTARGSLKLDALHRPEGTLTVDVAGYREVLGALVRKGTLAQGEADTIGGALDLLAALRRGPKGRVPVLLIFQKGKLLVGPVQAATLKPLF